jgi:hypothetical protein
MARADPSWYDVTTSEDLEQGDILRECPIPTVLGLEAWPVPEGQQVGVDIRLADAVVLSQSCDLVNDKIDEVILVQVLDWQTACRELVSQGNRYARSRDFRKALIAGNSPSLSLLHKHDGDPGLAWSVVDFHRIFVLPKSLVRAVARSSGRRLRLRSSYREHLAQAFARYFMRVGLPHDAQAFEQEGQVD